VRAAVAPSPQQDYLASLPMSSAVESFQRQWAGLADDSISRGLVRRLLIALTPIRKSPLGTLIRTLADRALRSCPAAAGNRTDARMPQVPSKKSPASN